jgi:hypothetical protein
MLRLLASLRTTLLLVALLVALCAFGAFAIHLAPEGYASIEAGVLREWIEVQGISRESSWVLGLVGVTVLLALNACACVSVALFRSLQRRRLTARTLWAHLAHLGFLLVLLGHLIGSVGGFRSDDHPAFAGEGFSVPERPGWEVRVEALSLDLAPEGYPRDLSARVSVRAGETVLAEGNARVNRPVFTRGAAVYVKDVRPSLREWTLYSSEGATLAARLGEPLPLEGGGTLLLRGWTVRPGGAPAVHLVWAPPEGRVGESWISPVPGALLFLPGGPALRWGEMAVDELGTFDVRYDPGAPLALWGGVLLSVSLVPLLRPRRRRASPLKTPRTLSSMAEAPNDGAGMMSSESDSPFQRLALTAEAARSLKQSNFVRDLDRSGTPNLLIKVPELAKALESELGLEVDQADDGSLTLSVLLYDIPTEPITYEVRLQQDRPEDQKYLRCFLDAAKVRIHPCGLEEGNWRVGPPQSFELPTDVLLRLRHLARDWPGRQDASPSSLAEPQPTTDRPPVLRSLDPRDTVIRKLKEQVQALREQLQERDKRIIEIEDELHEIRSRGRPYKLTPDKKRWWKPFA